MTPYSSYERRPRALSKKASKYPLHHGNIVLYEALKCTRVTLPVEVLAHRKGSVQLTYLIFTSE